MKLSSIFVQKIKKNIQTLNQMSCMRHNFYATPRINGQNINYKSQYHLLSLLHFFFVSAISGVDNNIGFVDSEQLISLSFNWVYNKFSTLLFLKQNASIKRVEDFKRNFFLANFLLIPSNI